MKCDACQDLLLDLLYEELDEVRSEAVQAHFRTCPSCDAAYRRLTEGQQIVSQLPLAEPSPEVEDRILAAARAKVAASRPAGPSSASPLQWIADLFRGASGLQLAVAAAMVAAIGIGVLYVPRSQDVRTADRQNGHQDDAPAHPTPAPMEVPSYPIAGEQTTQPSDAPAPSPDHVTIPEDPPPAPRRTAQSRTPAEPAPTPIVAANEPEAESTTPAYNGPAPEGGFYWRGVERYGRGEYEGAIDDLERALSNPGPGDGSVVPSTLHHLARSHRANGACGSAVPHYERLIESYPEYTGSAGATLELAECYRRLGQLTRAEQWYQRALAMETTRAVAQRELLRLQTLRRESPARMRSSSAPDAYDYAAESPAAVEPAEPPESPTTSAH